MAESNKAKSNLKGSKDKGRKSKADDQAAAAASEDKGTGEMDFRSSEREVRFVAITGVLVAALLFGVIAYAVGKRERAHRADSQQRIERAWHGPERDGSDARAPEESERSRWLWKRPSDQAERLGVSEAELEEALREHREAAGQAREEYLAKLERLRAQLAERLGIDESELGLLGLGFGRSQRPYHPGGWDARGCAEEKPGASMEGGEPNRGSARAPERGLWGQRALPARPGGEEAGSYRGRPAPSS